MRNIIFTLLITIIACSSTSDLDCGITPPDWLQGRWKKDATNWVTFSEYDKKDVQQTLNNGNKALCFCEQIELGKRTVTEVQEDNLVYTYRIDYGSTDIHYTYFVIDDNTIGFCEGEYPCNYYSTLIRNQICT